MNAVAEQLKERTMAFALNATRVCRSFPLVVEESDEAVFWLKFAIGSGLKEAPELASLLAEARELLAIFIASARTAGANSANRNC